MELPLPKAAAPKSRLPRQYTMTKIGLQPSRNAYGDVDITVPPSLGASYPPTMGRNVSINVAPESVAGSETTPIPPPTVLTIANEGTGTGLVFDKVLSGTALLRTLQAGTNIAISTTGEEVLISATAAPVSANILEYIVDTNTLGSSVCLNPTFPGAVIPSDFVFPGTSTEAHPPPYSGITLIFDAANGAFRAGQVSGGQWTQANRGAQSFAWGLNTTAINPQSFCGGSGNVCVAGSGGAASFIGAGSSCTITPGAAGRCFIGAGENNVVTGDRASVVGGQSNQIVGGTAEASFIGGGGNNIIISSGPNVAINSFIGGGAANLINGTAGEENCIVGGTTNNISAGSSSFIGGGISNAVSASLGVICGGQHGIMSGQGGFIGAGGTGQPFTQNAVSAQDGFVGAGYSNTAGAGAQAAVVCGNTNTASGAQSFIGAGATNTASGAQSFMGAGVTNMASGQAAFVGAGAGNTASGHGSVVVGGGASGGTNTAAGQDSCILGGFAQLLDSSATACALVGGNNCVMSTSVLSSFIGAGTSCRITGPGSVGPSLSNSVISGGRPKYGGRQPLHDRRRGELLDRIGSAGVDDRGRPEEHNLRRGLLDAVGGAHEHHKGSGAVRAKQLHRGWGRLT